MLINDDRYYVSDVRLDIKGYEELIDLIIKISVKTRKRGLCLDKQALFASVRNQFKDDIKKCLTQQHINVITNLAKNHIY